MLTLHVAAGLIAIPAGAVAMTARKGSVLHRRAGIAFVAAMLVMSALGAVLAVRQSTPISVLAGMLTFYLVGTGLVTIRGSAHDLRAWVIGFMWFGFLVVALAVYFGLAAAGVVAGPTERMPAAGYFVFGAVALGAARGDARLLRAGDLQGTSRLRRHLWRMSLAMLIACMSFFLGQAKVFPEVLRESGLLPLPVLATVGFLLFWLVRTRVRRSLG